MKVVILAAGKGSRLRSHKGIPSQSETVPKPLTLLDSGLSIMEHQLKNLSLYTSLNHVILVVGYHKEEFMEKFPNLLYVYNPDYAKENTSKSLLRALEKCDEDVLWMNGDVVFHPSILEKVLKDPKTRMIVNVGAVGEEEVKYRQDKDGKIIEISKHVNLPQGEALGINYIVKENLDLFRKQLALCQPGDYFERAIEACIENGVDFWSASIDSGLCTEVDFPEDLKRANAMLKSW